MTRKRPDLSDLVAEEIYQIGVLVGCNRHAAGGRWEQQFIPGYKTGGRWALIMAEKLLDGFMFLGEPIKVVWRQPTEVDVTIAEGAVANLKECKFPKKVEAANLHLTRVKTSLEWAEEAKAEAEEVKLQASRVRKTLSDKPFKV